MLSCPRILLSALTTNSTLSMHNGTVQHVVATDDSDARRREIGAELSHWWDANARDLPWRFGRTSPWGVLISEVMSQQTQMSRVVPYWLSWMAVWPDAAALAGASTAEVITAWGRLGYPRRALRLRECARVVAEQYHNELPHSYEELIALPGIGDYTASAVMSFAFGSRIAVIDTNIRRVLSRVFLGEESLGGSTTRGERDLAESLLSDQPEECTVWNQSLMELGALVCTAKQPLCSSCPLAEHCRFRAAGFPGLGASRTRPRQHFAGTDRQVRGIVLNALRSLRGAQEVLPDDQTVRPADQTVRPDNQEALPDKRSALPDDQAVLSREQVEQLWADRIQLDSCIASLDDDGLVEILPNGSLRLPS